MDLGFGPVGSGPFDALPVGPSEPGQQPAIGIVLAEPAWLPPILATEESFAGVLTIDERAPPLVFAEPSAWIQLTAEEWVPPQPIPPPPPPGPSRPVIARRPETAGLGGYDLLVLPPPRLPVVEVEAIVEVEETIVVEQPAVVEQPEEAEYVLVHPQGSPVRALAVGVVTSFVDVKGRTTVRLCAEDGTVYWYADVAEVIVEQETRVTAGTVIARTRVDQPDLLPEVQLRKALPPSGRRQPVFVDPPPPPRPRAPIDSGIRIANVRGFIGVLWVAGGVGLFAVAVHALTPPRPLRRRQRRR